MGDGVVVVNPAVLTQHLAEIARLERELEVEKKSHREADGEIIKLRAAINGVQLTDAYVKDLVAPPVLPVLPTPETQRRASVVSDMENVAEEEEEQEKDSLKASDETTIKVTPSKDSETKKETAKEKVKETKNDEKKVEKKSQDTPKASAKDTPDSVTPEVASTLGKLGLEHPH